ncbi:hypothetical protein BASA_1595 [Bifidobacterium animalis subsp. animalis]|nr:hypothetical protein BASA_1595 [Bifidobacterium animalis subsp. animalis]
MVPGLASYRETAGSSDRCNVSRDRRLQRWVTMLWGGVVWAFRKHCARRPRCNRISRSSLWWSMDHTGFSATVNQV